MPTPTTGARLVVETPEYQEFPVEDCARLGRNTSCDIVIDDEQVSREHCRITRDGLSYYIEDNNSRNGVTVNAVRVQGRALLKDGDVVTLGQTSLKFRLGAQPPPPPVKTAPPPPPPPPPAGEPRTIIAQVNANQELFSGIAGTAELQKANANLRMICQISDQLAGTLDVERLLNEILDKIFDAMKADRGVIFLLKDDGSLHRAAQKARGKSSTEDIQVSQTILRYVLENQAAVLVADAARDQRFAEGQSILIHHIQSAACAPLICRNKLLGVLQVESTQRLQAFNQNDLQLLTGICGQAAIAIENANLVRKAREEEQIRTNLQRYLAPQIAKQVIEKKVSLQLGGQVQKVTVLFSDMRGFTRMTNDVGAREIVTTLNQYFERMVAVIFRNKGTLDKFVGDAIMALWGVPIGGEADPVNAVRAAIEMQRELFMLDLYRRVCAQRPLYMGIGLNTGEAVVGNMGAPKMMQFTAMGATVNQASRIEGKTTAGQVLLSETTLAEVRDTVAIHTMPPVELKGFREKVPIWTATGLASDPVTPGLEGLGEPSAVVTWLDCDHVPSGRKFQARGFDMGDSEYGIALPADSEVPLKQGDLVRVNGLAGEPASGPAGDPDTDEHLAPLGPMAFRIGRLEPSPADRQPPFVLAYFLTALETQH